MRKVYAGNFRKVARPILRTAMAMGLSGDELDDLIEEAKAQTRPRH